MQAQNQHFRNFQLIHYTLTWLFIFTNFALSQQEKSIPEPESSRSRAEITFTQNCSSCHSAHMQAFVDRKWKYGNSFEELYMTISKGRGDSEAGMPAFGEVFSDEQIKELVSYIRHGIENVDKYKFKEELVVDDIFSAEKFKFRLEKIADGMDSPWGMVFLPDDDMLVTDKSGKLWRCKKDKSKTKIDGVPAVLYEGQGGLLDIELHPGFAVNKWLYLAYSKFKEEKGDLLSTTVVSRFRFEGNKLTEERLILEALPYSTKRHHYGGRLEFDNDGYLYITVGDRGERDVNPQDLSNFLGKVHRVHDDGRIPDDNAFVTQPNVINSIYSFGHRNPQGLVLNPSSGKIWTHEHGPRGGDEINIIQKGANYGWPVISYGIDYDGTIITSLTEKEGMEQPVHYWVPSIAPCGMDFVKGDLYPGWKGHLLVGSLRFKYVNLCKVDGNRITSDEMLMKNIGRVRQVKESPDGYIYVAVEEPGIVYKIVPLK